VTDAPSGVRIRPIELTDEDLAAYVALWTAVSPDQIPDPAEIRWSAVQYPGGARLVAEAADGAVVGAATVGRVYMFAESYDAFWADVGVVGHARRRGIGTALLAACSAHARAAGKVALVCPASEARPEGLAFLEHHGFAVIERAKQVRLELAGLGPPEATPPPGIRLTSLAERPDLADELHAIAVAAFPDIPGDEPMHAGTPDEFRARDIERPGIDPAGIVVALDDADGRVVGYATIMLENGRPGVAFHDMTAVHPAYRGRGIATALKRATIAWAIRTGLTALETDNDEANAPMREVNRRLGYRPLPDWLLLRGPLVDAPGDAPSGGAPGGGAPAAGA
jgi:GNAT superfamily N-acetyltransferase